MGPCAHVHHVLTAIEQHREAEVCARAIPSVQCGVHQGLVQVQHQGFLLAGARLAGQEGLAAGCHIVVDGAQAADEVEGVKLVLIVVNIICSKNRRIQRQEGA